MSDLVNIQDLYLGRNAEGDRVWVDVKLSEVDPPNGHLRLSIMGEIAAKGHKRDGAGSAFGQISFDELPNTPLARRIGEVWKRWHLNDMRAGCEHQRAMGWNNYLQHPSEPCSFCGYRYGTAWLYEPLPDEIVAEVKSWAKEGEANVGSR